MDKKKTNKGSASVIQAPNSSQAQAGEAQQIFHRQLLPTARQEPGFKSALQLLDPTTGQGLTIIEWETEQAMKQARASENYQKVLNSLQDALGPSYSEISFEIVGEA